MGISLTPAASRRGGEHWRHRQWTPLARALAAVGDRWTLLIVVALGGGPLRLRALRERLPGISTGVLDGHIQQMVADGLLGRRRFREVPPRVEVELTDAGRELLPIAAGTMRWGMRHAWGPPTDRERRDAAALVRSLPLLLAEAGSLPDGRLEAVLLPRIDADGPEVRAHVQFAGGVLAEHGSARRAARPAGNGSGRREVGARVLGDDAAWLRAFEPDPDYGRLTFEGDVGFAAAVLDALPGRKRAA